MQAFSFPSSFAARLCALRGTRRWGTAFFFGALGALAFPPYHAVPLLLVAFPALVLLLRGAATARQGFGVAWFFAFGLLTVSLYWIAGALLVDAKNYGFLVPLAVFGLPAVFSLYYGIAGALAVRWGLARLDGLIVLALLWFGADYARGTLLTGFPWDAMGYVWADCLPVLQGASLGGVYGLTLLTLLAAILPAGLFAPRVSLGRSAVVVCYLALAFLAGWGAARVHTAREDVVPFVRLRLVQPALRQSEKWRPEEREANYRALLDLSLNSLNDDGPYITHVIWPETATAFLLEEEAQKRREIGDRLGVGSGRVLLTGALRRDEDPATHRLRYYNSLLAIDDLGRVTAVYDKHHLVPFGEYIPFRAVLPLRGIAAMGMDFSAGRGPATLRVEGLPPFSPLICYEAVFSGEAVNDADPPHLLVNVTNDAWYEGTTGPAQHFAIARMRAVEEGLPLVRVANKGVVGVVDPFGRVVAYYGGKGPGFVDSDLPAPAPHRTFYARHRDEGAFVGVWALFVLAFCLRRYAERSPKDP